MEKDLYQQINRSKFNFFIIIVSIIKMVLMGLCSSDYQNELFIPFVTDFITNGGNPYQRFYELGIYNAFPYPTVMLLIESFGAGIISLLGIKGLFWTNFFFKVPSFIIDIIGLYILTELFPEKRRYIAVFYYASPIVIYAVYMHGQLDLIPTMLMLFSVCIILSKKKNRYVAGAFLTTAALLCKLHILAVIPVVVIYLFNRDGIKKALEYVSIVFFGFIVGILPVLSEGFIHDVLFNTEQSILTNVYLSFATVKLYIPIFAVFLIYLIALKLSFINDELFLNLCTIVFAVFLAFCPPMQGWYVWIVPYVAMFFVSIDKEKYKNILIYICLNLEYLSYFLFLFNKGYVDLYIVNKSYAFLKINNSELSNIGFTLLTTTLLYFVISMYRLGVAENSFYKRKNIPFTIGISGDSGAGKSTMIGIIEKCLGDKNLQFIEGDGDHRWERGDEYWNNYTALNPKANYLYRQAEDLKHIRSGSSIRRVDYDHNTGRFTEKKRVKIKRFMILCGLHSMYLPQTRKYLDLKIYMDADETLRRYWKIIRDTSKRGYTKETILKQIDERMPDAKKYIYPQKEYADMIVKYYDKTLLDCMDDKHQVRLSIQLIINLNVNVEPLVDELIRCGLDVQYDYSDDLTKQMVSVDADDMESMTIPVETIARRIVPHLEEISRENFDSEEINGKDGVIILFLLLMISNRMRGESE